MILSVVLIILTFQSPSIHKAAEDYGIIKNDDSLTVTGIVSVYRALE